MYLPICMKQTNVSKSKLIAFQEAILSNCLTICQSIALVVLSAFILTACGPERTTNNYGVGAAGMSGSGQTKDPGDGSGGSTGDGGGGQGIQCENTKDLNLSGKLYVRDIYEAIHNHSRTMKTIPNDISGTEHISPEAIQVLTDSLKSYLGPASHDIEFTKNSFWEDFLKKIVFLDDQMTLVPSTDANSPISLPRGCKVVQIAYWDESPGQAEEGTLYVNKRLWTKLNQLNKVGLLAHEYFFKQARKAQYKNSDATRNKVGELLSTKGISPLFKNWLPSLDKKYSEIFPRYKSGFKMCRGTSPEDPSAKLLFYQYEGANKTQHLVIPVLASNNINASLLSGTNFTFDPEKNNDLAMVNDLMIYQTVLSTDTLEPTQGADDNLLYWYTRWFDERDFPSYPLNLGKKEYLDEALTSLSEKNELIWSVFLQSSPRSIKFSIVNPAADKLSPPALNPKSRDELIYAFQKSISRILKDCSATQQDSDRMIVALNKEISDSIKAGEHPRSFPIWNSLLKKLDPTKCDAIDEPAFQHEMPSLLYSLTINTYEADTITHWLERLGQPKKKWTHLSAPRIQVSQDNSILNFDLHCDDYESLYKKLEEKRMPRPVLVLGNKKVVRIKHINDEDAFENRKFYRDQGMTYLIKHLSLNEPNDAEDYRRGFLIPGSKCDRKPNFRNIECTDEEQFEVEFVLEKKIEVTACNSEALSTTVDQNSNLSPEVCAVIKMTSTNHSFKTYFRTNKKGDLSFTFIRFLGIAKERNAATGEPIE